MKDDDGVLSGEEVRNMKKRVRDHLVYSNIPTGSVSIQKVTHVKIKKLHKDAIIPEYHTDGSAGFDFHSLIHCVVPPFEQRLIPTGLAVEIPPGTEIQLRPRSGLALKHSITVTNSPGTIDSDYRGELKVILFNMGTEEFIVKPEDRIAQGVLAPYLTASFELVKELSNTKRGTGGYGHTG